MAADIPRPKAVVVISGHWEEECFAVQTAAHPPLLFDYYGFPPHTYELTYPAPGAPDLGRRVRELLEGAGHRVPEDREGQLRYLRDLKARIKAERSASDRVVTATPSWPLSGSRAMIDQVIGELSRRK